MQLIVLGMHRSGTSATSRMLNMLGAYLGEMGSLMAYHQANPKGFWENIQFVEINEGVLAAQGCDWRHVSAFDPAKLADEALDEQRKKARNFLLQLDTARPWAVKDPRMCLTLPFWLPLLEVPVCVLVHRKPLEIARSLRTLHSMPLSVGIALWERYVLAALSASADLPRILVDYHALLEQPVATFETVLNQLQALGVRKLARPADREILAFVDRKLHREQTTDKEQEQFLNLPQRRLLKMLREGAALARTEYPPLSAGAVETLHSYEKRVAYKQSADQARADHEEALELARSREAALAEKDAALEQKDAALARAREEAKASDAAKEALERSTQQRLAEIAALKHEMQAASAEHARQLAALEDKAAREQAALESNLNKELATKEREIAEHERAIAEREGEIARVREDAHRERETLEQHHRARLAQQEEQLRTLRDAKAGLRQRADSLTGQMELNRTTVEQLKQEVLHRDGVITGIEHELRAAERSRVLKTEALETLEQRYGAAQRALAEKEQAIHRLERRAAELSEKAETANRELAALVQSEAELRRKQAALGKELEEATRRREEMANAHGQEVARKTALLTRQEADLREFQARADALERALSREYQNINRLMNCTEAMYNYTQLMNKNGWWRLGLAGRSLAGMLRLKSRRPRMPADEAYALMQRIRSWRSEDEKARKSALEPKPEPLRPDAPPSALTAFEEFAADRKALVGPCEGPNMESARAEAEMTQVASLESRETAYRQAARGFDYFVTGTAAVFFLVSTVTLDSQIAFAAVLDLVAVIFFALGLIAGLRKLEACITILGTDYSIAVTRSGGSDLSVRDTDAILEDLGETVEKLSYRAALIHRARNRCIVLGIIAIAFSRALEVALVG